MEEVPDIDALKVRFNWETRANLLDFWVKPIVQFVYQRPNGKWANMTSLEILRVATKANNRGTHELADFCSRIYFNQELMKDYYNSFSEIDKLIINEATWNKEITQDRLTEICGGKIWFHSGSLSQTDVRLYYGQLNITLHSLLKPWMAFLTYSPKHLPTFNADKFEKVVKFQLQFSELLKNIYAPIIPKPKGYFLKPIPLPKDNIVFNAEKKIFNELPLFLAYFNQGNLAFTQKNAPLAASVKKMHKVLEFDQFPHLEEVGIRNQLMAGIFSGSFKMSSNTEDPLKLLKHLFDPLRSSEKFIPFPPFILMHLKGIRTVDSSSFRPDVTSSIFKMAASLPVDEWISKESLTSYLRTRFINMNILAHHHLQNVTTDFNQIIHFGSQETEKEIWDHIYFPNFLGHFYLMAAFGLVEIAVQAKSLAQYSYYDDLMACRLTKLGAYVFGITDEYVVPELAGGVNMILSENNLTAKTEGNTNLAEVVLKDYLQKVSENRFQLTAEYFLKDCGTTASLTKKINGFKHIFKNQLPVNWDHYFAELITNSEAVKAKSNFFIFRLPENNKELIRLVAQDPDLKKIIIKAEQFFVMVQKKDKTQFISRMKVFGYLVEEGERY